MDIRQSLLIESSAFVNSRKNKSRHYDKPYHIKESSINEDVATLQESMHRLLYISDQELGQWSGAVWLAVLSVNIFTTSTSAGLRMARVSIFKSYLMFIVACKHNSKYLNRLKRTCQSVRNDFVIKRFVVDLPGGTVTRTIAIAITSDGLPASKLAVLLE
jgi:hypothetical protein